MSNTSNAARYAAEIEVTQVLIREKIMKSYGIEYGVTDVEYIPGYDGKQPHFAVLEVFRDPERLEAWREYFLAHPDEWKPWSDLRSFDLFGRVLDDGEPEDDETVAAREEFARGVEESILDTALAIASDYDERLIALHYELRCGEAREAAAAKVGEAIRARRQDLGLTMQQVAVRTGLYRQRVSEIEQGKGNITIATLAAIAAALETTFEVG